MESYSIPHMLKLCSSLLHYLYGSVLYFYPTILLFFWLGAYHYLTINFMCFIPYCLCSPLGYENDECKTQNSPKCLEESAIQ